MKRAALNLYKQSNAREYTLYATLHFCLELLINLSLHFAQCRIHRNCKCLIIQIGTVINFAASVYTQPPTIRQSLICDPGFRFALRRQFQILCVPEEFSVPQQLRKKRLCYIFVRSTFCAQLSIVLRRVKKEELRLRVASLAAGLEK